MKIIHVGLGDFGRWWYSTLCEREKTRGDITIVAVVDRNEAAQKYVQPGHTFFTNLNDAIIAHRPDFVLNATPPHAHRIVCEEAFAHNLPVLVEKPISENYDDVKALLQHAQDGQKLVVSENYRYFAANRFVREQIHARLQNITGVTLLFRRRHTDLPEHNYHRSLAQPMAIDIGTHHIDLLRFFTGREVTNVHARLFTPAWSWYTAPSRMLMTAQMEGDIHFNYEGSMDALPETGWNGHWTFTAQNGTAIYTDDALTFHTADGVEVLPLPTDPTDVSDKNAILDDFMHYVKTDTPPPTHINDQANVADVLEAILRSARDNVSVSIPF